MTESEDRRIAERAQLLPEEQAAGSDDPEAQAAVVLADSDERTAHPERGAEESTQVADR
jgi:hypothetical protein